MTLDTLDRAFLDRWSTAFAGIASRPPESGGDGVDPRIDSSPAVTPSPPAAMRPLPSVAAGATDSIPVVDRLLTTAAAAWDAVADEVEAARLRGRRVIAVTACDRAAGCTTLVAGLARVLTARGRQVGVATGGMDPPAEPAHGRGIVLVDAGVWFPPGRINRGRLMIRSAGCDAAILVRREDRPAPAGWSVALEAIGVEPLGEVISFAGSAVDAGDGADR